MLKLESKNGTANGSQLAVYQYLSNFRNFAHMLPAEQLNNLEVTGDTIRFAISGLGMIGLKLSEKKPYEQFVVRGTEDSSADFTIWVNIAAESERQSRVNLVLEANLNMFIEMMARGPLQKFADMIIDKITALEFKE
jgi:carbon monoxide dehydrogenase subunit G